MSSRFEKGRIHYTLDGRASTPSSPVYESPLTLEGNATVKARFFDETGRAKGEAWQRSFSLLES